MKCMNSVKNTSLQEFLVIIAISLCAIILASCGDDDSSTSSASYNMDVVSDVSKLPKCTKSNEGEMAWVKGETSARVCVDEKWYSTVGSDSTDTFSCSTKELKDKSGVKIICNGDSVGVVFNGKDGSDGKNGTDGKNGKDGSNGTNGQDGVGCSISKIDEQKVRVICGKDSTILFVGSESDESESSQNPVVIDSEKVAVSLNEVSGVSQKGPFLSGSRVLIREMEDGRTLTQTGNSFNGKILNDKGEFKIKARMLVSQYVMLEASGYYRNEITGENSNSELTLFAITDVNDRNTVNINLLTHLEYERVIYLVTQKKMKVQAAKKQAQKEVLALLDVDATDFSNSEDLNIAGGSDEDGALLAFSIILQGNRSVSQLSELLQKIANDMEEDGKWDNTSMRASLADWAAQKELDGKMESIRKNVTNWQLSTIVPNFEKHIHNFGTTEYGLGKCSSENEGKILQNSNKLSQTKGSFFICKSGKWTTASSIEYDTYQWAAGKDGDCKTGDVNSKNCYVYENKMWRSGNSNDCTLKLRGCTALRQDTVGLGSDKVWYKCDAKTWRVATNIEKDTATWGAGKFDGEVRAGQVNKSIYYIYEISKKTWRNATTIEKDTYDYKNNKDWAVGKNGEIKKGSVTDTIYVFDKTAWRVADDIEKNLGGCVTAIKDSVGKVGSTYYICKSEKWVAATQFEYDTYRWTAGKDGDSKYGSVNINNCYVFEDNVWRSGVSSDCSLGLSGCTASRQDIVGKGSDRVYHICDKRNWRNATTYEKDTYGWNKKEDATVRKGNVTDTFYVYENEMFRIANSREIYIKEGCTDYNEGNVNVKSDTSDYVCKQGVWQIHKNVLIDERDGLSYQTVRIGTQIWMSQDLNYADSNTTENLKGASWCGLIYGGNTRGWGYEDCDSRVYYWNAAMDVSSRYQEEMYNGENRKGVCPNGWHLPSKEEWNTLINFAGGATEALFRLKDWGVDDTYGRQSVDEYGFSAWDNEKGYYVLEDQGSPDCETTHDIYCKNIDKIQFGGTEGAYYWTSSQSGASKATVINLTYCDFDEVRLVDYEKNHVLSVRCVKDEE
ncbi:FISUMP domain-containing protein [Fibrobacter sp. UWB13]|uniref:FISUMP domain-containing protein n=1 Tax=Fibrobacter sp. UWB13 TaxID=1896204 RepID=UPI000A0CE729|nr:FISUMP domain-containing protein [Fibrobacter sp. UWB13]SMG21212.1 major paralogous domain-containing protein [Fibrobacter sp. UWB13]